MYYSRHLVLLIEMLFFIALLTPQLTVSQTQTQTALSIVKRQLSSGPNYCDHNRLQRCQQDITTNIQELSNVQSGGYTGISSGYQSSNSDTHTRCSAIRQNLDCLLMHTPPCQNRSIYDARTGPGSYDNYRNNPGDFIRRGKQTIERFCEQGGGGWRSASCYTRQDVRSCETQFGYSSNPPPMSSSACRNYQDFRDCVVRIVRQSCYSQDLQLMATYLIDKGGELSWSCVVPPDNYNPSRMDSNYNDPYRPGGSSGSGSSSYGTGYDPNRHDPNRGVYDPNRPAFDPNRDRTYDRDRYGSQGSQYGSTYDRDRYSGGSSGSGVNYAGYAGASQYPGTQNQPIDSSVDRFGGSGGYFPTTDSCLERSGYFVRTCEDTLIQRQRDAREGRSSNDVQRRICCALFFYRDCISRVVVDRCRDPSPTVVDILMGSRKRDLTVTCREYSRDQCSASTIIKSSLPVLLSVFVLILMLKTKTL